MLKAINFEDRPWKIGIGNSAIEDRALKELFYEICFKSSALGDRRRETGVERSTLIEVKKAIGFEDRPLEIGFGN
jgi:hypothetical protein